MCDQHSRNLIVLSQIVIKFVSTKIVFQWLCAKLLTEGITKHEIIFGSIRTFESTFSFLPFAPKILNQCKSTKNPLPARCWYYEPKIS